MKGIPIGKRIFKNPNRLSPFWWQLKKKITYHTYAQFQQKRKAPVNKNLTTA